jgi:hypothetical protein
VSGAGPKGAILCGEYGEEEISVVMEVKVEAKAKYMVDDWTGPARTPHSYSPIGQVNRLLLKSKLLETAWTGVDVLTAKGSEGSYGDTESDERRKGV